MSLRLRLWHCYDLLSIKALSAMSLRRPTAAVLLFTSNISPFCDVAPMSDCGTHVFYFQFKPFTWCRLDARLRHDIYLFVHPSRRRFRHPIGAFHFYSLIVYSCFI